MTASTLNVEDVLLMSQNEMNSIKENTFLKKNWDSLVSIWLFTGDLILFNLSYFGAQYIRFNSILAFVNYYQLLIVINILFLLVSSYSGLYRGVARASIQNQKEYLRRFTINIGVLVMAYLFLIKGNEISRGVILIFLMVQYIALDFFHVRSYKIFQLFYKRNIGSESTLIVGADDSAIDFYYNLKMKFDFGYDIKGFIKNGHPNIISDIIKEKILGGYHDIDSVLNKHEIERVFIISDSMYQEKYNPIRDACEKRKIMVKMVSPQTMSLLEQFHVKDITGVPLTTSEHRLRYNKGRDYSKRWIDVLMAGFGLLVISPFLLIIVALIKLTSDGPVFFKQKRSLSANGAGFMFYKFRTMFNDAEERKAKLMQHNESNGALFKMKDDPRITKVGKWLRKYSLDELPQLINVLKGEMSLVGPRPLPINDFENLKNQDQHYDWYEKRAGTKPGITGLWQISGRSKLSFEEMVMLDLYYIENQSIFFDLEILFDTLPVVLTGKGAY